MKKIYSILFCTALLFAGCTQDFDEPIPSVPTPDGLIAININGSIDQTYTTRVDDGGFCDGDQIGLYGVNYTDNNSVAGTLLDEGNQVDNARYTFDETNWHWTSAIAVYYKDAKTNIDLYGYYPYANVNSVNAYKFEVAQDQSGANAIDGYAQSDFLWGKAENISPSENKVKIKFNHRLACANVILAEGDGFAEGEFTSLEKGVLVMNTTRIAEIDLATGVATAIGEVASEGIVMKSNAEGFRAIVVPQSIEAGKALFTITVNGISYRFKKDADFTYEAGKQSKFTIEINKKEHSGDYEFVLTNSEIIDWIADLDSHGGEARQYYCIHVETPGTLADVIAADGKDAAKIENIKISGTLNTNDFYFIRDSMKAIEAINLKEVKTVDCKYNSLNSYGNGGEYVNNVIPDYALRHSKVRFVVFPEYCEGIGFEAFCQSELTGAIIIPDDVIKICSGAFYDTKISSISFPAKLKELHNGAISSCDYLSGEIHFPEGMVRLQSQSYCNLSGRLILPNSLEELGGLQYFGNFTGGLRIPDKITGAGEFDYTVFNGELDLNNATSLGSFVGCGFRGELRIPDGTTEVGNFGNNGFSSVILPKSVKTIRGLSGNPIEEIIIPEGVVVIENYAFAGCSFLRKVELPSSLVSIGSDAFSNCFYMSAMQCNATEPPILGSGVFNGVPKDNFILQVPERSVTKYKGDTEWGQFRKISANHSFSIERDICRTLNKPVAKTYTLYAPANHEWAVESNPDWITITPSTGIGKTKIVVSIKELNDSNMETFEVDSYDGYNAYSQSYSGRAGEIVFLLKDKDCRSTMRVEQYDYEYADGDVIKSHSATKGNGIDIVFMGDCYDAKDIADGKYLSDIEEAIGYYFDVEPYKTYKDYFNVYAIFGESNDSGIGTVNTVKDAKFGSQYSLQGMCVEPDFEKCFEYAYKADSDINTSQTLIVLILNSPDYNGVCYMYGDGSAIACCPKSEDVYPYDFRGIVQHEAGGHGFGKLGDEYIYHNAFISDCDCRCCSHDFSDHKALGWYRNLELFNNSKDVGWSHLIFHPKYRNTVDIFEGGYMHSRGVYRSEETSCMNNNIPYYSAISRQAIVERIMEYAGETFSLESFYENDSNEFGSTTRSMLPITTGEVQYNYNHQHAPVYMGDKPNFRK